MAKRIHIPRLSVGRLILDAAQAHHARDVLRLGDGAEVEAFDDAGHVAAGVLRVGVDACFVEVEKLESSQVSNRLFWTIAAAVPKGQRADWMIEKLSELGASAFIPLQAARSIVLPEGKNKIERWARIATEAAKQSRRAGVMRIDELTALPDAIAAARSANAETWFLATEVPDAMAFADAAKRITHHANLTIFVGPEGGWTPEEIAAFGGAGIVPVRLGATILRIETAAVAAAALVSTLFA